MTRCHNKKPLCIKYRMALGKLGGRGGFLILGLWGYITSYKGISTKFVRWESSMYSKFKVIVFFILIEQPFSQLALTSITQSTYG